MVTENARAVRQSRGRGGWSPCVTVKLLNNPNTSRQRKDDISLMIRSQVPLTDDGRKWFATSIIRMILDYLHSEGTLQKVSAGTEWTVSYSGVSRGGAQGARAPP